MFDCRSTKKKKKHDTTPQTPLFVGLVAAVVGAVWYLRKRATQNQGTTKPSTTRSAFKFPEPTKQSGLPRNSKSSNNKKKSKAKRRAEKAQKKADKYVECRFAMYSLVYLTMYLIVQGKGID